MTINKLTLPAKDNAIPSKVNDIVDELGNKLENTSNQNYSLTIDGTANTQYGFAVNIGKASAANGLYVTAIGAQANGLEGAVAVGLNAHSGNYDSVLGYRAGATGSYSVAIGANANVSYVSGMGNPDYAIQLGYGTNSTAKTLAVGFGLDSNNNEIEYELLNGTTGLIPDARISANIARTNQIPSISNLADKDLSNLSATGEKHFLNKTQITNCILEAPNGTHTSSGSTLTLKAGLKVLMPIGRNTNGTMNNIEYAIPSDISFTYPFNIYIPKDFIWVEFNGTIDRLQAEFVYYINWYSELVYTGNNQYRLAYVAQDNLWYFTSDAGNTWTSRTICPVGYATIETNNTISALSINGTARIFTQNDRAEISRFSLPTSYNIGLAIGASGTTYTAPANGYFYVGWHATVVGGWALLYNASTGMDSNVIRSASGDNWWYRCHMPVRQGDVVYLNYDAVIDFVSFHYMSYIDREIR